MNHTGTRRFIPAEEVPLESLGGGIERRILGHDAQMMMTQVCFQKGAVGARHQHMHRQVTFVAEGTFAVTIGDETRVLVAGDCFFVPPGVDHGVVAQDKGILVDVFSPAREDFLPRG